jgi:hypothetical protein
MDWCGEHAPAPELIAHLDKHQITLRIGTAAGARSPSRISSVSRTAQRLVGKRAALLQGRRIGVLHPDPAAADTLAQALRARGAEVALLSLDPTALLRIESLDPEVIIVEPQHFMNACWDASAAMLRHPLLRWASVLLSPSVRLSVEGAEMQDVPAICADIQMLCTDYDAAAASGRADAEFTMALEAVGPGHALRLLFDSGKRWRARFTTNTLTMEVDIAEGLVVGARGGRGRAMDDSLLGTPALASLLAETSGVVHARPVAQPAVTNIMAPLETAIASALRASVSSPSVRPQPRPNPTAQRVATSTAPVATRTLVGMFMPRPSVAPSGVSAPAPMPSASARSVAPQVAATMPSASALPVAQQVAAPTPSASARSVAPQVAATMPSASAVAVAPHVAAPTPIERSVVPHTEAPVVDDGMGFRGARSATIPIELAQTPAPSGPRTTPVASRLAILSSSLWSKVAALPHIKLAGGGAAAVLVTAVLLTIAPPQGPRSPQPAHAVPLPQAAASAVVSTEERPMAHAAEAPRRHVEPPADVPADPPRGAESNREPDEDDEQRAATSDRRTEARRAAALTKQGTALLKKGRAAQAKQRFEAALQQHPRDALALAGLTRVALQQKDASAAKRRAQELASARPTWDVSHLLLGDAYKLGGDPAAAKLAWRRAARLGSRDASERLRAAP